MAQKSLKNEKSEFILNTLIYEFLKVLKGGSIRDAANLSRQKRTICLNVKIYLNNNNKLNRLSELTDTLISKFSNPLPGVILR